MKTLLPNACLFLLAPYLWAQQDTLHVNNTHNLLLVFPDPIEKAITGHPNFSFGFDPKAAMRMGLLQGHPGVDSNLLVVTEGGNVYAYYLEYRKLSAQGHRFVSAKESIGNLSVKDSLKTIPIRKMPAIPSLSALDSINFEKGCAYFLRKAKAGSLKSKRKGGIALRIKGLDYFGSETYLTLELENGSKIDLEVDFVKVYKVQGNPGKKSSHQKLEMPPLFIHQMPALVRRGQRTGFVHVLPKFTLGKSERIMVELREKRGSRRTVLLWR